MSSRMAWSPASSITQFRVFTLSAGIQLAAFQPSKCTHCQRVYLGGWCFKRSHSHAVGCRWVGPCPQQYFVIPRIHSCLGASVDLLGFVSSKLLHLPATFASIFRVWQSIHREQRQQELLTGVTGTLHRNNVQRLEDTWLTYQAVVLAGVSDWDFSTPAAFDDLLFAYVPLLRAGHFSSVIAHFESCVECQRMIALITDGKFGARRRVCVPMWRSSFPGII